MDAIDACIRQDGAATPSFSQTKRSFLYIILYRELDACCTVTTVDSKLATNAISFLDFNIVYVSPNARTPRC
jgi:hypothetical protein